MTAHDLLTNDVSHPERKENGSYNNGLSEVDTNKIRRGKKVMGVQFAPLKVPWERRMESLAVASWICTFLFMGPCSLLFFIYLFLFTNYFYISILYFLWYLFDRDVCNQGGRRSEWVRNWKLWKRYCNFFPIHLVKTVDLDKEKNYLLACHPHGVLCSGAFGCFATEGTSFSQVFPNITPHLLTLEGHYQFPLYREYLMLSGTCSASRSSLNYLLSHPDKGHAAVLVPGGPSESLDSRPGNSTKVHLNKRKGFIKIALQNGASVVPCYSFGETSIYDQVENPEGSLVRRFQNQVQKIFGLAPVIFKGRGFFQYSFGILPQRRTITTVVGKPIHTTLNLNPTQEEIDELHETYIKGLLELFDKYRAIYGDTNDTLEIV